MDLACGLRKSWRSSRLPTSLGCHQISHPYSATAWTHATWTALMLSRTTLYVLVWVRSLASAALDVFMHRLCSSVNIRCACIQTATQGVAYVFNRINPVPTRILTVSFGRWCFQCPILRVNRAASVVPVSNCSPCQHAHSMLFAVHLTSMMTTRLTLPPLATYPRSSTNDSSLPSDTYSSTHLISPEV